VATKPGLKDYLREAFSARPIGMFIPPNWVGLAVFGLLGFVNAGFWILGAGLELAYLYVVAMNPRFQRLVNGKFALKTQEEAHRKMGSLVQGLPASDAQRYRDMERRCRSVLDQQPGAAPADVRAQAEALGRLLWIFLRLLLTRQAIKRVLNENSSSTDEALDERIRQIEEELGDKALNEDLRKSKAGQLDILRQRRERRTEARAKISFLDSELSRLEEQADLIREQSVLTTDPNTVLERVDQIAATLGGTSQWIREQQQMYGQVEDLLAEPPPVVVATPGKERT
jgi:vacuolar-type H+-ATPase subunit I/STV1